MNDEKIMHFLSSEEIFEKAREVFEREKKVLESVLPETNIEQVGSSAVPGAIGKFDIDIQIRTIPAHFTETVEIMRLHYPEKHPELWTDEFAIFRSEESELVDYMVTVIYSKYDDFYRVRDHLIANPDILEEYNNLKRGFEGKTYAEYRKAKAEFLGGNGRVRFLEY